jgi:hypothetical protein
MVASPSNKAHTQEAKNIEPFAYPVMNMVMSDRRPCPQADINEPTKEAHKANPPSTPLLRGERFIALHAIILG